NAVWRQPTPQETVEIVSYASTLCAIGTQQARILEVWCVVQTFLRSNPGESKGYRIASQPSIVKQVIHNMAECHAVCAHVWLAM
ncbi:hypothetical protein, partial [Xanthomonas fragariae]|uniref:hypothetical protein n=5 Tax=Xanthomonas fragariae TaxID=48664 RepID=UPI001F3E9DD0